MESQLQPTALVIFGITGDLAHKKLIPALFDLFAAKALPEKTTIFGFARRDWTDEVLQNEVATAVRDDKGQVDQSQLTAFTNLFRYMQSDFTDLAGFQKLAQALDQLEQANNACTTRIFYFATPASAYQDLLDNLKRAHLANFCPIHGTKNVRIVIEKPFGQNLASAKALNQEFLNIFTEDQLYRIDHYLGKETVQNILAFRFANMLFEPIWCNEFIDSVQITMAEAIGIETRGAFYEETGALRDVAQNHLLQLLTAVAMEQPQSLSARDVRSEREKVLAALLPIRNVATETVRGQYASYRGEEKVAADSDTETYVALQCFLDTDRFRGVPFYLRTGKKLKEKVTDITVVLKPKSQPMFHLEQQSIPNTITLRLQPNEGISVRLFTKQPGKGNIIVPTQMDFCYRDAFGGVGDDAYNRLLLDVMAGDQTLFTSSNEVAASWHFITPILDAWERTNQQVFAYADGSWGPQAADEILERNGRKWLAQHIIVCPIHEQHTI